MSSSYVRDNVKAFLATEVPTETVVDLSAEFQDIADVLDQYSLTINDPWLGIQFLGAEELPVSLTAGNSQGRYREIGTLYFHIVAVSAIGAQNGMLARAEALRDKLRGQVIADRIYIEQVSPPNFGSGATIDFEAGYTSAVVTVFYRRELDL